MKITKKKYLKNESKREKRYKNKNLKKQKKRGTVQRKQSDPKSNKTQCNENCTRGFEHQRNKQKTVLDLQQGSKMVTN